MDILQTMQAIMQPSVLLFMLVGVIVGTLIGSLPGLSVVMAIALFTPITFLLEPTQGLAMLIGIYNAGVWAGGISAVLINTPGTPASIMSTLDGYAMTQRGEAGLGLGINTVYSVIGGIFSSIVLMFAAFPIANFALNFGPAEYAMLAFFGLSMIISVSGKELLKGIIVGLFGLLIATVGTDVMFGNARYTLGVMELRNGIPFIPVMIGLFGIGEILDQITQIGKDEQTTSFKGKIGRILPTGKQFRNWLPATGLSAVIGVIVGAIPGTGGDIASIVSWDQARRISKDKENYGKGSPEALAVTCLSNNAIVGGAMTTMLALGIPGDGVTAVLIGSLMMYSVRPGPMMFIEQRPMVLNIMGLMIVANLFILLVGLTTAKSSAKMLNRLSKPTIWIVVAILCLVGSYAISNSLVDVWIAFAAGILGFIFRKTNMPLAPFVLAIILGPMFEANLRRTLTITGGSYAIFVTNPISLVLLVLSILSFISAIYRSSKAKRKTAEEAQA